MELYRAVCMECRGEDLLSRPDERETCVYCNHPYMEIAPIDFEPRAGDFPPRPRRVTSGGLNSVLD